MRLKRYFGLLYAVLVLLIVSIGVWWVVFLSYEGSRYEKFQLARMEADSTNAALLINAVPEIRDDPKGKLGDVYPHLTFREVRGGFEVSIDPAAVSEVRREAGRRRRMFTAEGIFLLCLLAAGSTILTLAYRSEREFKRARELFLAGATHELKTPLASLRLYTETLGRERLGEKEATGIRERMLEDVSRLETLLEQILALGYDEDAARSLAEVFDAGEEAEGVLQDMQGYLSAHEAAVETDLPAGHRIRAPRLVFALVLRNLVSNAVSHSDSPARVRVTLQRSGSWLRLAVRDWGPGIARKHRERIFRGFSRVIGAGSEGRNSGRAGLGLYLVKRQTEMMGGRVELGSEVGEGSTFTLVLPACDGDRT